MVCKRRLCISSLSFFPLFLVLLDCHPYSKYRRKYTYLCSCFGNIMALQAYTHLNNFRLGLDLWFLKTQDLEIPFFTLIHSKYVQCHLSVTILMLCPVIVSMPIRTRMSSICLQIGFLQFCSQSLLGGSFNLSDLNAHSKWRNPNSLKMAYF